MFVMLIFAIGCGNGAEITGGTSRMLGNMTRQIAAEYFMSSRCLAVVTESSDQFLDDVFPLDIPTHLVHIPLHVYKTAERTTPSKSSSLY